MLVCPTCHAEYAMSATLKCPTDGSRLEPAAVPPAPRPDVWEGRVLGGRYRLGRILGTGGMGSVWLATDEAEGAGGRRVAVKVMRPEALTDNEHVRRFWQEARAARAVSHPNVVRILDFGEAESRQPFLVMEYVQGETLDALVRRKGRVPVDRAIRLACELLDGLTAAHQSKVMHRDIKPQNLMVTKRPDGLEDLKLLDFGLAKASDANPDGVSLTETGVVFGTPDYMSPEQARGEKVDFRTDLYAVGVVLYEMVAGRRPFEGNSAIAVLLQHMRAPVPAFELLEEPVHVPPALASVIYRALHKSRDQRFQSAHQMRAALMGTLESHTLPDVGRVPAAAPATGGGWWLALGAAGVLAVLGVAAWQGTRDPTATPDAAPTVASVPTSAAVVAAPPAKVQVRFESLPTGAAVVVTEPATQAVVGEGRTPTELSLPGGRRLVARFAGADLQPAVLEFDAEAGAKVLASLTPVAPATAPVSAGAEPTAAPTAAAPVSKPVAANGGRPATPPSRSPAATPTAPGTAAAPKQEDDLR